MYKIYSPVLPSVSPLNVLARGHSSLFLRPQSSNNFPRIHPRAVHCFFARAISIAVNTFLRFVDFAGVHIYIYVQLFQVFSRPALIILKTPRSVFSVCRSYRQYVGEWKIDRARFVVSKALYMSRRGKKWVVNGELNGLERSSSFTWKYYI